MLETTPSPDAASDPNRTSTYQALTGSFLHDSRDGYPLEHLHPEP
jgi:hypothetical protein